MEQVQQVPSPEVCHTEELTRLTEKKGPRPSGWLLTPQAVVTFVYGSDRLKISRKFVGDVSLVEGCVITLTGERALLLVREPGAIKPVLSKLLSVIICGISDLTAQDNAGTTKDQPRYGWNYVQLSARGPSEDALVDSPVLAATRTGRVARVEEITRCLPEVQDMLVLVLSECRLAVPEPGKYAVRAAPGFCVIATVNLRDRGASEMDAALKRRLDFEVVEPITDADAKIVLVMERTRQTLVAVGTGSKIDEMVVETSVTAFREPRSGVSQEGWAVGKPPMALSTAEVVTISGSIASAGVFSPHARDETRLIPGQLLGVVREDDSEDGVCLLAYWNSVAGRCAADGRHTWVQLWEQRHAFGT